MNFTYHPTSMPRLRAGVSLLLLGALSCARPAAADVTYIFQSLKDKNRDVQPTGISSNGIICGYFADAQANEPSSSFLYQNGAYTEVPAPPGSVAVYFDAINSATTIPCSVTRYTNNNTAFVFNQYVYKNGAFGLPFPDAYKYYGINDEGTVAGTYTTSGSSPTTSGVLDQSTPYMYPGAGITVFTGISNRNSSGKVLVLGACVTFARPDTVQLFIVDSSFTNPTLVTPPDNWFATHVNLAGINKFGTIIGYFTDSASHNHGFVRTPNNVWQTVDDAGASDTYLTAISDNGSIVGYAKTPASNVNGFILTPEGAYNMDDVVEALPFVAGFDNVQGVVAFPHYDADHDGQVTLKDIVIMLRKAVGTDVNP